MYSALHTAYFYRGDIIPCVVEVEIKDGIGIHVVGLPDSTVKESLLRVCTALQHFGFSIPGKKVVINIAPHGGSTQWAGCIRPRECFTGFDLAILFGILIASEQIGKASAAGLDDCLFYGALRLDGKITAPYTGITGNDAASILAWQLRRSYNHFITYPVATEGWIERTVTAEWGFDNIGDVLEYLIDQRIIKQD